MFCALCRSLILRYSPSKLTRKRLFYRSTEWFESKRTVLVETERPKIDLSKFPVENIRNFCIIAHVDHGKSTLADRLLEITGTIPQNPNNKQVLDKLQVERERGITVKAQTASLFYTHKGVQYMLNLIDTPGHVDFNYEVARSLAACQGAILVVDANQGVQAQTVANFYLAFGANLVIIPVLNKIDLKNANPAVVAKQMNSAFEFQPSSILRISAKFGTGVEELLIKVIEEIPQPSGSKDKPFRALIFDSWYDRHRGVISHVAVVDGSINVGNEIMPVSTKKEYEVRDVGILNPDEISTGSLSAGQVGYVVANIRSIKEIQVGDTLCLKSDVVTPLAGFTPAKPMVYAGVFAMDQSQIVALRKAVDKLVLNDSSVSVGMETSPVLGQGWRLGFLGLLHMEVFTQRLEQEYDAQVIITVPSVPYKAKFTTPKHQKIYGNEMIMNSPLSFPDPSIPCEFFEPMVIGTIITPQNYLGKVIGLCIERRGIQLDSRNLDDNMIIIKFKLPLSEIIVDFYDELKTMSSGYASFDYEDYGYEPAQLVKLLVLLNGQEAEELTTIVTTHRVRSIGQNLCLRLKETLPQHQFQIAIQAVVGSKVIARENLKALRKDVTAKLYGGDVTRRKKLLERQAEGKKRLRMIGNIVVPRDAFIKVLKKS